MTNRYRTDIWSYQTNSVLLTYRENEISRITINDTFNNDQIVVEFPVKVCKRRGGNPDYYGVYINNAMLAKDMAERLCEQMNRESGYRKLPIV
jgi:hypothetical protein